MTFLSFLPDFFLPTKRKSSARISSKLLQLPVQPGSAPVRISVGQDKEGSLTENSHIRHARDGIIQTVQVVDVPDDHEKQVAEKRKLLEDYLSGAGKKKQTHTHTHKNKDFFKSYDICFFFNDSYGPFTWIQHHKFLLLL